VVEDDDHNLEARAAEVTSRNEGLAYRAVGAWSMSKLGVFNKIETDSKRLEQGGNSPDAISGKTEDNGITSQSK